MSGCESYTIPPFTTVHFLIPTDPYSLACWTIDLFSGSLTATITSLSPRYEDMPLNVVEKVESSLINILTRCMDGRE